MASWYESAWVQDSVVVLRERLPTVGVAFLILIGGWILAFYFERLVFALLRRTTIDDKIASLIGIETGGEQGARIERVIAKTIYYGVLSVVFVVFFSFLKIDAVTQPLVTLQNEIAGAVPNLMKAAIFGLGGYLVAKGVRRLILAGLGRLDVETRINKLTSEMDEEERAVAKKKGKKGEAQPFSTTIADVAYWFILIVVSIPVLEALSISALAGPLSSALATVTNYLPKVGGAAVLLLVGYLAARAARGIVSGVLSRVGIDRVVVQLGFGAVAKENPISKVLGTVAMVFVFLQFAIAAVGRLELAEISGPLSQMLQQVYAYLPKLFVGGVVLTLGVLLARVAGNLTSRLFAAVGFNSFVSHLGLFSDGGAGARQERESRKVVEEGLQRLEASEADAAAKPTSGEEEASELFGKRASSGIKTPADIAGLAVGIVIVLLFLKQALATLDLASLSGMLDRLIEFLPHVVASLVVLGAGLWAGAWAHKRVNELVGRSDDRLLRALGPVTHAVIVVFAAMVAVQQLGVGTQLIAIAFGVILGAICLALALAFGLGGREVAARIVADEYEKRKR